MHGQDLSTHSSSPAILVDFERYPLEQPGSAAWHAAVQGARDQLAEHGWAELSGFIVAEQLEGLIEDASELEGRAWRSSGRATPYLSAPDDSFPQGHPRRAHAPYRLGAVAYDLFPADSLLRRIYEWEPLRGFLEAILNRGTLYPYGDAFGALNLAVMDDGDELQWHFDQTDFVVSLAIQTAHGGGEFEVVPHLRTPEDESYDEVSSVLAGTSDRVVTLAMTPGTLLIFEGRHALHRVTPVEGTRSRLVGLLAYDTMPGRQGSDELRLSRYGRTEPYLDPPPRS